MGDLSPHFSREEMRCKGVDCHPSGKGNCGFDTVDAELLNQLENVRGYFNKPVAITSGCRCIIHNERVGGAHNSQHLRGRAADIIVKGVEPDDVAAFLDVVMLHGGVGRYSTFTHLDTRTNKHISGWSGA